MSMSLATHITSFLIFFPIGITRLLSSMSLFLNKKSQFKSKPLYFPNLHFHLLLLALPISSFTLLFFFLSFSGNPTYRFPFLHQSFLIFLFWVLLFLIFLKESCCFLWILDGFLFGFAGVLFLVEYLMCGGGVVGFGVVLYDLLGELSVVCCACCLFLAVRPTAFFADFLLCVGIVLKGTWVLQVGVSVYSDVFGFEGCKRVEVDKGVGYVKCELDEYRFRGVALVNLVFIGHVIVVLVLCFVLLGLLSYYQNRLQTEGSGSLLAGVLDPENTVVMRHLPDFEME